MGRLHYAPGRRCLLFSTLICLCVGLFVISISLDTTRSKPSACSPNSSDKKNADWVDAWRYQNSVTGQWHFWRSAPKTSTNSPQWSVKWLNTAPNSSLGVIVYLSRRHELETLNRSLAQLYRLLVATPRPVVIFHEEDLADASLQESLAQTVGSRTPLAFERVDFSNNSHYRSSVYHGYPRGYLAMCRFFTLMLPTHPLMSLFSYYWRLDSHSYLFSPKPIEDPFELMQKRKIQYAFIMTNVDAESFVTGLWDFFHTFLARHCLTPSASVREIQTSSLGQYSHDIIFNNFAISNVSLWRDNPIIQAWLQAVDRHGGIYQHRWGDAPIHTLALTQFIAPEQIARLRYFGYFHRREYVCAKGTDDAACVKQAEVFCTNPQETYLRYDDGCFQPRSSLCHYYQEITM